MRAALVQAYGPPQVVRVGESPNPTPGDTDVLVRIDAVAVTSADARIRAARFPSGFGPFARLAFGVRRPRRPILGSTFAGTVTAVGARVEGLSPGDAVCGMTGTAMGAHAEYVAVPAARVVAIPPTVSPAQAAGLLFGGTTALYFLRDKAAVRPGARVLVTGASGAVGTNAVQLARHFGAVVTAVTSTPNVALVQELGAERVVDYTSTDVTALADRFDVVFDTVGSLSRSAGVRLLSDDGVLLLAVAGLADTVRATGRVKAGSAPERGADFTTLLDLVAAGDLVVVNEEMGGLDAIVAAHERVDSGRKVGNIVIRPAA